MTVSNQVNRLFKGRENQVNGLLKRPGQTITSNSKEGEASGCTRVQHTVFACTIHVIYSNRENTLKLPMFLSGSSTSFEQEINVR